MLKINVCIVNDGDSLWLPVAKYADTCSWGACARMAAFMREGKFSDWERLFVTEENNVYMGFCALLKPPKHSGCENSPLIKWLFVEEKYRGHRLSQKLIEAAAEYAKGLGYEKICLTTWHADLYIKYGFIKLYDKEMRDGYFEGVYEKKL